MKHPRSLKNRMVFFVVACLAAVSSFDCAVSNAQGSLSPSEQRGKQIYFQGTSPSGKSILAYLGDGSLEVPGSSLPCANCHGLAGQGTPEGGVNPSNITWEALTKPYGVTHASGRKHPPYTNRGLDLALTRGLDPAGNKLLPVMPRYAMSREDMADLIVYLARLGSDIDPGIHESKIVIGTLVPTQGNLAELGQAIRSVTAAYFADVNAGGGVYNRRLELSVAETGATPAATQSNLERSFIGEPVFAMTGAFIAGSEKEVLPFARLKEVPLVGPFTLFPRTALNQRVFYLLSGLDDQSRAAVEFAVKQPGIKGGGAAVVYPESENNKTVVEAIQRQGKLVGLTVEPIAYVAGSFNGGQTAKQIKQGKREAVFLLGATDDAISFMKEAEKSAWSPLVFLPTGSSLTDILNAPPGFDGRIFMALPSSPADISTAGINEFRAFSARHKLPGTHVATQILAYSSAKILVESLKRAGKELTREKFVQALEGLYEYQTGLTPPITFGPNRRVGALGAYLIMIDLKEKKFVPAGGWISLERLK